MFLDLTTGEQERRGGGSLSNTPEAMLALNVYQTLKRAFGGGGGAGATTGSPADANGIAGRVGVISPYARQVQELKRTFLVSVLVGVQ